MVRHDAKAYRRQGEPSDVPGSQIDASPSTLSALQTLRERHGPQVIVLGSACAGIGVARVRSETGFVPVDNLVRIGTLAHCPVYADEDTVARWSHRVLILDVHSSANGRPVFVTRPESAAEWQQRVFADRARRD
jgi:uncharacterized protein (DUF779 family)